MRATNVGGRTASRPRWASMTAWLGRDLEALDERAALAELVRRWLQTFGPGTERDLRWWLGATAGAVRTALRDVAAGRRGGRGRPRRRRGTPASP